MNITIGKRIVDSRLKSGVAQKDAAGCIGVSLAEYSMIENGSRPATADEIGKLAELFHVSTDWLIFGVVENTQATACEEPFDLKRLLSNSLLGYIEINLSRNEIIGDVIETTNSGKQIIVDPSAPDGTRLTYDAFAQWWAENMLVSSKEQFLGKCNCNWLISRFRSGKKTEDV